ncbi:MAG: hypothetical protein JO157_13650 [Acetobacteraceae bacterium]|nr:hypothetical protein [Acetobacteraceae bacterium]
MSSFCKHTKEPLAATRRGLLLAATALVIAPRFGFAASPGTGNARAAPGRLPAFRYQALAAQPAGSPVTLGHFFARGDLPAGSTLAVQTRGLTVPVALDQVNAWPSDGSVRFAALSFLLPHAVASGQIVTFQLAAGAAPAGSHITVQQIVAASDFKLKIGGGDYGSDTFTVSANDILQNFKQWGGGSTWGANPLGGWEMIRSSPICTEVRVWRYLKRDGDGASHRWVKAKLYVRAWSDGRGGLRGFQVLPGLFQENSYGAHPRGSVGDPKIPVEYKAAKVDLYDGATRVLSYAGRNSPWRNATVRTMPQRGWWGALRDGARPFVVVAGATAAPSYMVAHDVAYATRRTRCLPPYDYDYADRLPAFIKNLASDPGYQPNVSRLDSTINRTGNDNGDDRYGFLSVHSAALLLNPLDPVRERCVLAYGWSWADWEQWICDERTGWPVNTGTDSSTCPSPANPSFQMYGNRPIGNPPWVTMGPANDHHHFDYGPYFDTSHMPCLPTMPLLRTGDAAFEEMLVFMSSATTTQTDQGGRNFTYDYGGSIGKVSYENVLLGRYQGGGRIAGHFIRIQGIADRMVRDNHPMRPFIKRIMSENSKCAANGIPWSDPKMAPLGLFYTPVEDRDASMFMECIYSFQFAFESWVGDYQGYGVQLRRMQPLVVGTYDTVSGGDGYNLTVYHLACSDGKNPYPGISAVRRANFPNDPGPHARGFRDPGYEQGTIAFIPLASALMQGWLETPVPRARETGDALLARYKAPPVNGINFTNGGSEFCPTWAIASRTAR